ncbi:class I SAM-dependent methyltransferase [Desulfocurvibacter africanus]|uniref:Methyltransferase type 11 n=1 Tax=Desulfocurvibacter africanus subsp. africanus str. Walvis Bay TaxID=690850 RepID=F3YZ19_DESAF|nr:class I SAM-dependent methyltransferase [Desulfocurvibacter africanus]EGJ49664.1 Methyltransferase type 11 [Desulfocurvibacter africanus subsp. africanus str. Walvis Bay]
MTEGVHQRARQVVRSWLESVSGRTVHGRSRHSDFGRKAYELCKGKGLEIGALHNPFDLDAEVVYLDQRKTAELRAHFKKHPRVRRISQIQLVWKGDAYPFIDDNAFDFVVNSHVLEHVCNPGRVIQEWLRIVRPGGIVYMVVPDKNHCFDRRREITSLEHHIQDYEADTKLIELAHYRDYIFNTAGEAEITHEASEEFAQKCFKGQTSVHAHTFTARSLDEFLRALTKRVPFELVLCEQQRSAPLHIHCALRKVEIPEKQE